MKEASVSLVAILAIVLSTFAYNSYQRAEDRKAYYTCLAVSERLAEQQKQPDGGIRIVSLPYCKN